MNANLRLVNRQFPKSIQKIAWFCGSLLISILLAQVSQAAQSDNPNITTTHTLSLETIIALIVGVIISIFYLRGMYLVLHYASETYDIDLNSTTDEDAHLDKSTANKILLVGSVLLVVLSAFIISSYGWSWLYLYIGPVLCLIGPIVVIVSMEIDIQKYRKVLREQKLAKKDFYESIAKNE